MWACPLKMAIFIGLFFCIPVIAMALIFESEPNNSSAQADSIACGDTVYCATLYPARDEDFFRFSTYAGDSIIAWTTSCLGSLTNTMLVLFNNRDSILAVNDNGAPEAEFSLIRYRAPYTGSYVLRVLYMEPPDTAYSLVLACPEYPPAEYDFCETPRIIEEFPYYDEGSTRGMHDDCRGTQAPDVFYRFHNPATANLFISVCTNQFDARVQILSRCCGGFMDDSDEGCQLGADLWSFNVPEGDYYIIVEGTQALQLGDFSIEMDAVLPGCPVPGPVVITTVGGYPFLDWPELTGPSYYVVWQSGSMDGTWEHIGYTFDTFYTDSSGYSSARKFYRVTSVCPW